jgi:hypothetical protein
VGWSKGVGGVAGRSRGTGGAVAERGGGII